MKTNNNLAETFNLAPIEEDEVIAAELVPTSSPPTMARYSDLDKISAALPKVTGLEETDEQLDELADLAITAHKDLMELSLNIEQRFCGEVAGAASSMLGHAIAARTNKIKKKLDLINLQIKKQVADQKLKMDDENSSTKGEGIVMDRNELLAHLLGTGKPA